MEGGETPPLPLLSLNLLRISLEKFADRAQEQGVPREDRRNCLGRRGRARPRGQHGDPPAVAAPWPFREGVDEVALRVEGAYVMRAKEDVAHGHRGTVGEDVRHGLYALALSTKNAQAWHGRPQGSIAARVVVVSVRGEHRDEARARPLAGLQARSGVCGVDRNCD